MKKITSLLMMFMLFVGMGWAQGTTVTGPTIPETSTDGGVKWYTIKSNRHKDFLATNQNKDPKTLYHGAKDVSALWCFFASGNNGGVKMANGLGVELNHNLQFSTNGNVWYLLDHTYNDLGIAISKTNPISDKSCLDSQGSNGVGDWTPTASDNEGTTWIFEVNTDDELAKAAFANLFAGKATAKIDAVVAKYPKAMFGPTDASIANLRSSLNGKINEIKVTVTNQETFNQALTTFDAACVDAENTLKATPGRTDILPDSKKTYIIENLNRGGKLSVANSANSDGSVSAVGTKHGSSMGSAVLWFLESAGNGKYYLKNHLTGEYINSVGSGAYYKMTNKVSEARAFALSPKDYHVAFVDGGNHLHMANNSEILNWGSDAANYWKLEEFNKTEFPKVTEDNGTQHLYLMKHKRSGKYATYAENSKITLNSSISLESFWYYKGDKDVTKGVKIYNTAVTAPLNDVDNGTFAEGDKTFKIDFHPQASQRGALGIKAPNNLYLDSKDGVGQYVTSWSANDDNTAWFITSAESMYNDILSSVDAYLNSNISIDKAQLEAAKALPHSTAEQYLAAFDAMHKALEGVENNALTIKDGTTVLLKNKQHGFYMLADNDKLTMSTAGDSFKNLWTLKKTEDSPSSYYLYNEYADKYVRSTTTVGTDTALPLTANVSEAGKYEIKGNMVDGVLYVGFKAVDYTSDKFGCLHGVDWRKTNGGLAVVRWEAASEPSKWEFVESDGVEIAQSLIDAVRPELYDYVDGYASNSEVATATKALQATANVENYKALETAIAAGHRIALGDAGYYQFIFRNNRLMGTWDASADAKGVLREGPSERRVFSKNATEAELLPSLWSFVNVDIKARKFKLTQANTGFGIGNIDKGNLVTTKNVNDFARVYTFTESTGAGIYAMFDEKQSGNNYINIFWNKGHNEDNDGFGYYSGGTSDGGNVIRIKQIRSIPVVVKDAKWATLNLPMAVQVPAKVKAYYVTSIKGDAIYVSEITNVIPANTPVLLNAEIAGTYNFEISTEEIQPISGNKLFGSNAKCTEVTDGLYYGLTVNEAKEVVFAPYVPTTATIPANKAMLAKENVPAASQQASVLHFVFGEPTGVEGVEVENENSNVYYDLNGRRVLYPAKGIFVNGNGQKVIFK